MGERRTVGMIVPPAAGEVPPEPVALYGDGIDFLAVGLALEQMTERGYDAVIDRVAEATHSLVEQGADAVSLMGTSLSFYRGAAFNRTLMATMHAASGRPVTTMSESVVDALTALGAKRLAVGTAYVDEVNARLVGFLEARSFAVASLEALQIADVDAVAAITTDDLVALGTRAADAADAADAVLISCGGLQTLQVTAPLEHASGLPVVTSATAGAWGAARLVGHSGARAGFGRLFELGLNRSAA